MSTAHAAGHSIDKLPRAKTARDWKSYLLWLIPIGAALIAAWFIYSNMQKGPTIHIYFTDATRLEEGKSTVNYRGAEVGKVDKIRLTPDDKEVQVTVSLKESAAGLARENSRFWIVKAHVGVQQIRGLGTLVSGDFITVEPGDGKPQTEFHGLDEPPVVAPASVLRIVLLSERQGSLQPRSPIYYRGIQVGEVISTQLGPKAQTIETTVDIEKPYAPLVRMNSVFWNAGGIDVNLSMKGADITAQSLKTLISGGIDFATPDTSQKPAPPGTTFRLYDKPQDAWLAWAPAIEVHAKANTTQNTTQSSRLQSVGTNR